MPESPEVTALSEFVATRAVGRTIVGAEVLLPKALKAGDVSETVGCRVLDVRREGKLLDVTLVALGASSIAASRGSARERHLVIHWGHDGWLLWHDSAPEDRRRVGDATLLARFRLSDGAGFDLVDSGKWKALAVFVVDSPDQVPAIAKLGPDPVSASFSRDDLVRALGGRRKQLKALLQDQAALAGIGNAYSDEILHAARLSPVVHASTLTADEIDRLFAAMTNTLRAATDARRGLPPEQLKDDKRAGMRVHRRPGESCPVCGGTIEEIVFSGAAAHYCATCQTGGLVLA